MWWNIGRDHWKVLALLNWPNHQLAFATTQSNSTHCERANRRWVIQGETMTSCMNIITTSSWWNEWERHSFSETFSVLWILLLMPMTSKDRYGSTALCSYPHVKVPIRDLSQTFTTALIFQQSHYFRQKYLEITTCAVSLLNNIWVRVEHSLLQQLNLQRINCSSSSLQAGCE